MTLPILCAADYAAELQGRTDNLPVEDDHFGPMVSELAAPLPLSPEVLVGGDKYVLGPGTPGSYLKVTRGGLSRYRCSLPWELEVHVSER